MRLPRWLRLLPLTLLTVPALVLAAPAAHAEPGDIIRSFDTTVTINQDSTFHVREAIDYEFASSGRHGIYRYIPVYSPIKGDRDHERVVTITNIAVTSPTGAPTEIRTGIKNGQMVIRVGSEDQTVSERESYVIDYDVSGAMNAFNDHVEFYWNVTGNGWDSSILESSAVVTAPVRSTGVVCFEGEAGANRSCATHTVESSANGSTARFTANRLSPHEGLSVAVAYPVGSLTVPPPVLHERWTVQKAFSVQPVPLGAAILVLLGAAFGVGYAVWNKGRDRRYVGQIPGLGPAGGAEGPDERTPLVGNPGVTVDFAPPKDMRPGEAGTLIDESADVLDVTATIVDLAVRRYLKIDEVGQKRTFFTKRDWQLTKLKETDDQLKVYEKSLFDAIFKNRDTVALSELKQTFAEDLHAVQSHLYTQVVNNGWFRRRPDSTRASYVTLGIVIAALGAGLTYVLARWTHFGLAGIAAVLGGLALVWSGRYMPAKTAKGSVALAQLLGFRQYIRTAEAEQIRFEEREDIFSRYLPYAIVFGETERWAKAFASLAAAGAAAGTAGVSPGLSSLYWYGAMGGGGFDDFADSLGSFTTSTAGSIAAAAPSSGSGFSSGGGFSGGGFGGGGGGSW